MPERGLLSREAAARPGSPLCSRQAAQHPLTLLGWGDFPPQLSGGDAWVLPPWHELKGGCLTSTPFGSEDLPPSTQTHPGLSQSKPIHLLP